MEVQMNTRRALLTIAVLRFLVRQTARRGRSIFDITRTAGFPIPIPLLNRPTVSPYLNLLNNPNAGVTSYQTLVRPMIDERDAIARQAVSVGQLQQQQRRQSSGKRSPLDDRVQAARFLNFSHYYYGGDTRR